MKQTIFQGSQRGRWGWRMLLLTMSLVMAFPFSLQAAETGETMSEPGRFQYEGVLLCPGGCAFGVKFSTQGVVVVGLSAVKAEGKECNPAEAAGIKVKDILLTVDGKEVNTVHEVAEAVSNSEGRPLSLTVERGGKSKSLTLTPVKTTDGYRAGMWLRDSTAGIGTVTYVNPETGEFGGLGHGICDADTGVLMPLKRGSAMKVAIGGVVKGQVGKPGEIKGYFKPERCGTVVSNTACGVFGIFCEVPQEVAKPLPVGSRYELKEGEAQILCTLGNEGPQSYTVSVSKIDRHGTDNKNFVITVTDDALKARSGGIVQGMSGSPIIQNGKLVGAVTHVLVNDPTRGYGIFIENMLETANFATREQDWKNAS